MSKKVMIATGGTGGHIYPAVALAQQLFREVPDIQVLFIGGGLGGNKYFDHASYEYRSISSATCLKISPQSISKAFYAIAKGVWQSRRIIQEFKPDIAVGFGSYYSFPPLVAAKLMSIPLVIHEANSIPGKVNRLLAKWSDMIGVHFPETVHLLKGRAVEVGMPLREGFRKENISSYEARKYFGLDPHQKTLLVFGGSQGANVINELVKNAITFLASRNVYYQVLHIAGDPAMALSLQKEYDKIGIFAKVKAFEDHMNFAWQAADVVVSRSGAGTIAEQLEFEIPGILIPFARAADNHQEHNAHFMTATVGGAVKFNESEITASRIASCLAEFLNEDCFLLKAMRQSMAHYKKKARNRDLCSFVKEYL